MHKKIFCRGPCVKSIEPSKKKYIFLRDKAKKQIQKANKEQAQNLCGSCVSQRIEKLKVINSCQETTNKFWVQPYPGGGILSWSFREGGKNACTTYFGHISSMEALIFIKFEIYDHKIVLDHQPNFRVKNARSCDAFKKLRDVQQRAKGTSFCK